MFYWHRENKNSNAEVDFLFLKKGKVVPVEVKAGMKGGMKSFNSFLDTHPNSSIGLKISNAPYSLQPSFEQIPLYGIDAWLNN